MSHPTSARPQGPGQPPRAAARAVVASAPTRLDFGGGWTDVPPYCDEAGGYVCNVAIARRATVRLATPGDAAGDAGRGAGDAVEAPALVRAALRRAGLARLHATVESDFPVGAGLGGSSAAGVALAAALAHWQGAAATPAELAEWSRAVEVDELGVAGGRQDHYAAALGGALGLRFGAGDQVEADRIPLDDATVAALERRCLVAYTGEARVSGTTITAVLDAYRDRDARVCDALARLRDLAGQMRDAVAGGDLDALGRLVGEHWRWQRTLHPSIPTARIDALLDAAKRAGAIGGKALGASGGGCVLVIAAEGAADAVRAAIAPYGAPLAFAVDRTGVTVADAAHPDAA